MKRDVWNLHTVQGLALVGVLAGLSLASALLAWELWRHGLQEPAIAASRGSATDRATGATLQLLDRRSLDELRTRSLGFPVDGVRPESLIDTFRDARGAGSRLHRAVDIMAPLRTAVRAVEDGTVARLDVSPAGGISVYQFDAAERYCYYYAHLAGYAPGLKEGMNVSRGQLLGYVGTTGNAPKHAPHLHFAIFRLSDAKQWWAGIPLNPYAVFR